MSKISEASQLQTAAQKITASLQQEVKIEKYVMSQEAMSAFVEHVQAEKAKDAEANVSLVDYITENFYAGQKNVVVVPDLSGLTIGTKMEYDKVDNITTEDLDREHESYLDLSGVDFTGANIKGAKFEAVNLANASFCDTDLADVSFNDCYMSGVDMRGADISNCSLSETDLEDRLSYNSSLKPVEISELAVHSNRTRYSGMHFSTLEPLMHQYRDSNEVIEKRAEARYNQAKATKLELQEEAIAKKQEQVNEKYKTLGNLEYVIGSNEEYNTLTAELAELQQQKKATQALSFEEDFDKRNIKYVMHPSVAELPLLMDDVGLVKFDPAYKRGSDKVARDQEKQYVRLTREDAESYIEAIKENPQLTMNEFAISKMSEKGIDATPGAKVIADFSTYIESGKGALYAGVAVDLSDLDFSNANLQGACFAGANLEGAKFNGANLNLATFEGANLQNAKFEKTTARDVNMFAANIDGAEFSSADFGRAYMSHSSAQDAQVSKTSFNFADIRNGTWDGAQVSGSTFNYADLEGISLANAVIKQTSMQHANLDRSILEGCEMIKTDLTSALMADASASNLKLKASILKDVDAREIDLSGAEIDELCKLEGIDLENAILRKIEADRVNFVGANMKGVEAAGAHLEGAVLEGVDMQFSNLEDAVMNGVKASGVDLTGANLTDIQAKKAQLKNAVLEGITGHRADLTEAVMEGANLRGAKMHDAILERVDLRNADLRNAELENAKLAEAQMEKAKVNDATDLHGADVQGVKGNLEHEDISGKKTEMSAGEKVRRDDEVHKAKQVGPVSKLFGKVCNTVGHYTQKAGEIIKQPFSAKWGRIIGAVLGAAVTGLFVASVVATGGASLVVLAAAVGGAALVGAASGAVAGHYAATKIGLSAAGDAVRGAGEAISATGKNNSISPEQAVLLEVNKQAQAAYTPVEAQVLSADINKALAQARDEAREEARAVKIILAQNVAKEGGKKPEVQDKAKEGSKQPALQAKATEVGKHIDSSVKTSVNASNVTPPVKQPNNDRSR